MSKCMLLLSLCALLLLSACAPAAVSAATPPPSAAPVAKTPAAPAVTAPAPTPTPLPARYGEPLAAEDLSLPLGGAAYALCTDSAPLLAALGDGYDYSEQISCLFEGEDKTFAYDGLTVSTVPAEGMDRIEMFTLTTNAYATARGIRVGASRDAVRQAYGPETFDDGYMTYTLSGTEAIESPRIQFEFSGDTLTAIYLYAPSY